MKYLFDWIKQLESENTKLFDNDELCMKKINALIRKTKRINETVTDL